MPTPARAAQSAPAAAAAAAAAATRRRLAGDCLPLGDGLHQPPVDLLALVGSPLHLQPGRRFCWHVAQSIDDWQDTFHVTQLIDDCNWQVRLLQRRWHDEAELLLFVLIAGGQVDQQLTTHFPRVMVAMTEEMAIHKTATMIRTTTTTVITMTKVSQMTVTLMVTLTW